MNKKLIEALEDLEKSKGISKAVILEALEKALEKSYEKNFNDNTNVSVHINDNNGDIKVYALKTVVDEVEDKYSQISLEEAKTVRKTAAIDDVVQVEVKPKNFGRVAAQTARNIVIQKLRDAERESIYDEYINRVKEMITGTVQRVDYNNIYINLGMTDGVVPQSEQIPGETYEAGDRIKLYVAEVRNNTKGPQVLLSRANHNLVIRLFEQEVPEIADGTVEIFSIAREAGSRSKLAVFSNDPNVDPIGACVGYKGNRVNVIVDELSGEKMDIVIYDKDSSVFISNALSPSKVNKVIINEPDNSAIIVVPDDQLSLAIGKEGQNVRLAAKLTGWKIDIKGQSQYEESQEEYDATESYFDDAQEDDLTSDNEVDEVDLFAMPDDYEAGIASEDDYDEEDDADSFTDDDQYEDDNFSDEDDFEDQ